MRSHQPWIVDGDEFPLLLRGVELNGISCLVITNGEEDAGRITPHPGGPHETMLGAVPFNGLQSGHARSGQKLHVSTHLLVHSDPRHVTSAQPVPSARETTIARRGWRTMRRRRRGLCKIAIETFVLLEIDAETPQGSTIGFCAETGSPLLM